MNLRTSQKKRKEILVQERGAFLAPLLAPVLGNLVGPLLRDIAGGKMAEAKKYVMVAPEVYEMLLIKAETPVNSIASTIKKISTLSGIVLEFLKKKRFDGIHKS